MNSLDKPSTRISTNKLNIRQQAFCKEYIKTGNGYQSALSAGYSEGNAMSMANTLLRNPKIQAEIKMLQDKITTGYVMSGQQVMEMFTKIANGEIKDQFGLDASLNDRIKALQELAKRTIDIENKIKGMPDMNVAIKLDWSR